MVTTRRNTRTGRLQTQQNWQTTLYHAHVVNKLRRAIARGQINNFIRNRRNVNTTTDTGYDFNNANDSENGQSNNADDTYKPDDECHRHRLPDSHPKVKRVTTYYRRLPRS